MLVYYAGIQGIRFKSGKHLPPHVLFTFIDVSPLRGRQIKTFRQLRKHRAKKRGQGGG